MSILNLEGAHENELTATGEFHPQAPRTALLLPSGQRVVLPTEVLLQSLTAGPAWEDITASRAPVPDTSERSDAVGNTTTAVGATGPELGNGAVIPLIAEQLQVDKQQVETARVRVRRETEEHVQTVTVPLTDVRWDVEHVPVERRVESQPEIRQVGETIIFPLVEERMVVTRELWLREEVHVRKIKTVVEKSAEFPVKRDVIVEERSEAGQSR